MICGLSYTTHLHFTSHEARARGANVDAHFLPKPKLKASNFTLRAQDKQSPVVYGGPVVYRGRKQGVMALSHQLSSKHKPAHSTVNTHLLWWCGAHQNSPKKREKTIPQNSSKRRGKIPPHMMLFLPFFLARSSRLKEDSFPMRNTGLQAPLLQKKGWFSPLPSGHGRHYHKTVYRSSRCDKKSWGRQKRSWAGQESYHGRQSCHHSRATTTVAQHSGGPYSSSTWNLRRTVWR